MAKTIIKEVGIVMLLLVIVVLILGIVFYDYIPSTKTVPVKIQSYTIPEDINEELSNAVVEGQNIVRTYYIDSTDLNAYESNDNYDKGKANPFEVYDSTNYENSTTDTNNSVETSNSEVYSNKPVK